MWGTDPALIDADEYCVGCEHSTIAQDDGSRHYEGCPEQAKRAAAHAEAVSRANRLTADTTIDDHRLSLGDKVWDYDLREAYVIRVDHVAQDGTTWYRTSPNEDGSGAWGLFDAKRMWHRHPSTGALA